MGQADRHRRRSPRALRRLCAALPDANGGGGLRRHRREKVQVAVKRLAQGQEDQGAGAVELCQYGRERERHLDGAVYARLGVVGGGAGAFSGRCAQGDEEYEDSCVLGYVSSPLWGAWCGRVLTDWASRVIYGRKPE